MIVIDQSSYPYVRQTTFDARAQQMRWLSDILDKVTLDVEIDHTSAAKLAALIGASAEFGKALTAWEELGIVEKRMTFETIHGIAKTGQPVTVRQFHYTFRMGKDAAFSAFDGWWNDRLANMNHPPVRKAKTNGHAEPVVEATQETLIETPPLETPVEHHTGMTFQRPLRQNEKPDTGSRRIIPSPTQPYRLQQAESATPAVTLTPEPVWAEPEHVGRGAEPVALATRESEEIRAIAGPEPTRPLAEPLRPLRKADDAEAAVEAARQYVNRFKPINDLITTLTKQGVQVDKEAMLAAVHFETDVMLENIGLILPLIDKMDATIMRQAEQLVEQRRKYADYDELKRDKTKMTTANARLVAEVTTLRQELIAAKR